MTRSDGMVPPGWSAAPGRSPDMGAGEQGKGLGAEGCAAGCRGRLTTQSGISSPRRPLLYVLSSSASIVSARESQAATSASSRFSALRMRPYDVALCTLTLAWSRYAKCLNAENQSNDASRWTNVAAWQGRAGHRSADRSFPNLVSRIGGKRVDDVVFG